MRTRLERAELTREAIEAAITELTQFGYLDDARYARVFAEDKRALEEWGRGRIERALSQRGIARELIDSALQSGGPDGTPAQSEQARAVDLLRRRFPAPPEDRRARERALGVLLRKGYDSDTAYDAVRAWAQSPAGGAP